MSEQYAVMRMSTYRDLCNKVREKTNTTNPIPAQDMLNLLDQIQGGGDGASLADFFNNNMTELNLAGVTDIPAYSCYQKTNLTNVNMPNVVTIGNDAFAQCYDLTSIVIPDSVTSIGNYAFQSCSNLTDISLPDTLIKIGNQVFHQTGYYQNSDNYEDGILYLGKYLLCNGDMFDISECNIKSGTLGICGQAFSWKQSLTSVNIPDSVVYIGSSAFMSCNNLENINLPNSIVDIGEQAFDDCYNLKNIIIPDNIINIGNYAFRNCAQAITGHLVLPTTLEYIGSAAFSGCSEITSVDFNAIKCNSGWDSAFYNCNNITEINIGDQVTKIPNNLFSYNQNVSEIIIPANVQEIEESAFAYCNNLTTVTFKGIPEMIYHPEEGYQSYPLGYGLFAECYNLQTVYVPWEYDDEINDYENWLGYAPNATVVYGYKGGE